MACLTLVLARRPKGGQPVCPDDRDIVLASGLAVVECSWARLDEVPWNKIRSPNERLRQFSHPYVLRWLNHQRLTPLVSRTLPWYSVPFLIATNPVNYGKPWRLVSGLLWTSSSA